MPLIGCVLDDGDSDGPSYRLNWPGVFPNQAAERKRIPTPVEFTTPISDRKPLEFLSFEADLPRIEAGDEPANPVPPCDRATGAHCTNPPPGARFYPLYTLARSGLGCVFQQGGTHLPATFQTFGGTSATEYGSLLRVGYPDAGFKPVFRINDFRRDIGVNPCRPR